jgi:adenine-specific DNA-methyltransferase
LIKYLGSKRLLIPHLVDALGRLNDVHTVIDLFSGTSRVGHALKQADYRVLANDHNAYAHVLARCYVEANADEFSERAERLLAELQATPPAPGYVTEVFSHRSRFFHPKNGERIDAIRERITRLDLEPTLEAIALVSLMEAADRVDSTTGVQMAYLKQWAPRAHNDLSLRLPKILPGPGRATKSDAAALVREESADLVYLDPPYNQHGYRRNYHIWESLVLWDKPEVYGVACKRIDCKTRTSDFNSKRRIKDAMREVVAAVDARHLLVSFNNEGYIDRQEMIDLLSSRGTVEVQEIPYARYVGAKIGIYNPSGKKVGRVSHTKNVEYLFHVRVNSPPDRSVVA